MPAITITPPQSPDDVFGEIDAAFAESQESAKKARETEAAVQEANLKASAGQSPIQMPYYIKQCLEDWKSGISHVFILHGNITDFPDASGNRMTLQTLMANQFDTLYAKERAAAHGVVNPNAGIPVHSAQLFAFYTINNGLVFPCMESREAWKKAVGDWYREKGMGQAQIDSILEPTNNIMDVMKSLNYTFEASKAIVQFNRSNRKVKAIPEIKLTVAFFNANLSFPNGPILHLQGDRSPIGYMYNWAQDEAIGDRNRIILLTPGLDDLHETIRGGDSSVTSVLIKRPSLDEREAWLVNYSKQLAAVEETKRPLIGGKRRDEILYSDELKEDTKVSPEHIMAIQTAGLNLRQMEQVIRSSWSNNTPITFQDIRIHKQRIIEEAFGGLVDFVEPEYGFEVIGGHDNLKNYAMRKIIGPLRRGDKRTCSKGVIWSGPPGCQPAGSKVLMADGSWKTVENIQIGDLVISPQQDGTTVVSSVLETVSYENKPIYEVATNGRSTKRYKCADNHIIPYITLKRPRTSIVGDPTYTSSGKGSSMDSCESLRPKRVSQLAELQVRDFLKKGKHHRLKARIFTTPAIEFPATTTEIPRYTMGALLGDGGFTSGNPSFTNANKSVFDRMSDEGCEWGAYEASKGLATTQYVVGSFASIIKKMKVFGKTGHYKYIPDEYKLGSIAQRLELLAGLIDTDGSVDSFSSCSELLANDFANMVHSVGGYATVRPRTTRCDGKDFLSFRVHYSFSEHQPILNEAQKSQDVRDMNWKNPRNRNFSITYTGTGKVFGFVLDSKSQWYITDDWLVTHNTGKSFLATAVAKESKMNFLVGHLDRLFGGVVGETESKTRKFISAVDSSAPCILFLDEFDSILSSGRSSPGDSGTSGRVFNSVMTFLSDESRAGRVVVIAATNRPDLLDSALIRSGRFDAILPALPPNPEDPNTCGPGRKEILKALAKKHHIKFDKELAKTATSTTDGLGRLFNDSKIWTGAEMEVVLKEAMDNCFFDNRLVISQKDWDDSMDSVMPNTSDVELQINLALFYINNLKYCPQEWIARAKDKGTLKNSIHTTMSEGGLDRE